MLYALIFWSCVITCCLLAWYYYPSKFNIRNTYDLATLLELSEDVEGVSFEINNVRFNTVHYLDDVAFYYFEGKQVYKECIECLNTKDVIFSVEFVNLDFDLARKLFNLGFDIMYKGHTMCIIKKDKLYDCNFYYSSKNLPLTTKKCYQKHLLSASMLE